MQIEFKNKLVLMLLIFGLASLMLTAALIYDQVIGRESCILCLAQRGVLMAIIVMSVFAIANIYFFKSIIMVSMVGIMLGMRHLYVLFFPYHAHQCLPLSFVMTMSGPQLGQGVYNWLSLLGHSCGLNVPWVTYVLVPVLLLFYLGLLGVCYVNQKSD